MKGGGARVDGREARDRLYEAFARTAGAAANPKRIELLGADGLPEWLLAGLPVAAGVEETG